MKLDSVQKSRARVVASLAGAATILLAVTACTGGGGGSTSSTPVAGGTLVYASGDAEPTCLDPHVGGNYPQALLSSQYIEELTALEDGRPVPALATSWKTSDDGKTLTFRLRDDVTFTDGTPFDAAAVVANLERAMQPDSITAAIMPTTTTGVSVKRLTSGPTPNAWNRAKTMPNRPSVRPICEDEKLNTSMVK